MNGTEDQAELIEALQGMVDRLCSPDLTLAESNRLYRRLMDLLERISASEQGARSPRPKEPGQPAHETSPGGAWNSP